MAFPTIQRVPLDVLREIALHALPVYPYPSLKQSPLSLSRVSSAWRAAVLSSPQLWKMLYLRIAGKDDQARCAILMDEWFQRAGALRLSFFLDVIFRLEEENAIVGFFSAFSKVKPRLQHFGMKVPSIFAVLNCIPELEFGLPLLSKFNLVSRYEVDMPLEQPDVDFMMRPPLKISQSIETSSAAETDTVTENILLQEVIVVRKFLVTPDVQAGDVPWSQLTAILLDVGIPIQSWIWLMDSCPKLCSCSMFIYFSEPAEEDDEQNEEEVFDLDEAVAMRNFEPNWFVLSDLDTLNLGVGYNRYPWLKLLSLFKLPALRNLGVYHDKSDETYLEFPDPVGHPALRNLRSLTLNAHWINSSEMVQYALKVLQETVNMEELRLEIVTHQFTSLFEAMSYKREPIILRKLTTLKLWVWENFVPKDSEDDGHIKALIETLESRCVKGEGSIPEDCERLREFWIGTQDEHLCEALQKKFDPLIKLKQAMGIQIDVQPAQESNQLFGDYWLFTTDLSWQDLLRD